MNKYLLLLLALPFLPACTNEQSTPAAEPPVKVEPVSQEAFVMAALDGDIAVVEQALAGGSAVDAPDQEGRTALIFAAFNGHTDIMKRLLLAGADANAQDKTGSTALMFASSGPFPESVQLLIDKGARINTADSNEHWTALMWAAAEGQADNVKLLIKNGADLSLTDIDGDTAESFAAQRGYNEVAKILREAATKEP